MPFVLNIGSNITADGVTKMVVCGGALYEQREMDEAIGMLMKARSELGPQVSNEAIDKAVSVVKEQLEQMGLMGVAKDAGDQRK